MKNLRNQFQKLSFLLLSVFLSLGTARAQDPCKLRIVATVSPSNPLLFEFKALPKDSNAIPCFPPSTVYNWNFGDAGTGSGSVVTHNYNQSGLYIVCVNTNTFQGVPVSECDTVNVTTVPPFCQFTFTSQPAMPVGPFSYLFTATGGFSSNNCYQPGTQFIWNWGDGSLDTTTNPTSASHTFPGPGTYNVCLSGTTSPGIPYQYCSQLTVTAPAQNARYCGNVFTNNACQPFLREVHIFSLDGDVHVADSLNGSSDNCFYLFPVPSQPDRNYVIWSVPLGSPANGITYLPTYLGDVLYFSEATVLSIPTNLTIPSTQPNINLIADLYDSLSMDSLQPPGLISGNVIGNGIVVNGNLGSRPTSITFSYALARIIILSSSGQPLAAVRVNSDGSYACPALPPGTYTLRVEHPMVPSQSWNVEISAANQNHVADFTVTPGGVNTVTSASAFRTSNELEIYPNPASGQVKVLGARGKVLFMDLQGKIVLEENADALISTSSLKPGVYMVKGMDEKGHARVSRLVIQ